MYIKHYGLLTYNKLCRTPINHNIVVEGNLLIFDYNFFSWRKKKKSVQKKVFDKFYKKKVFELYSSTENMK